MWGVEVDRGTSKSFCNFWDTVELFRSKWTKLDFRWNISVTMTYLVSWWRSERIGSSICHLGFTQLEMNSSLWRNSLTTPGAWSLRGLELMGERATLWIKLIIFVQTFLLSTSPCPHLPADISISPYTHLHITLLTSPHHPVHMSHFHITQSTIQFKWAKKPTDFFSGVARNFKRGCLIFKFF